MEYLTERPLSWFNLKSRTYFLLVAGWLLAILTSQAQDFQLIDSIGFGPITQASIDRQNHIYMANEAGEINKYDTDGKLLVTFSPTKPATITLLEAWQGIRVFVYYNDFQEYLLLDRFLTPTQPIKLATELAFAKLTTLAADDNIWVIDEADYSLKKWDAVQRRILVETPFSFLSQFPELEVNYIREYQNLLFIIDYQSGVLVFDNLGNYLKTMDYKNLTYLNFSGDQMYFLNNQHLQLVNIYNGELLEISLPMKDKFNQALLTRNRLILIADHYFKIYLRTE